VRLLPPSAAELSFHRSADFGEALSQSISDALAQIALGAFQAGRDVERRIVELLAEGIVQQRCLLGKLCYFSGLRRTRCPSENGRKQYQKYYVHNDKYA
jgi:hypothetical protein